MFRSKEELGEFLEAREWRRKLDEANLKNWEVYDFGYIGEDHALASNTDFRLSSKFIFRFIAFLLIIGYFIGKFYGVI